jgi:hypothetical protein
MVFNATFNNISAISWQSVLSELSVYSKILLHKPKLQTYTDNIEQVTFSLMTSVTGMYPMIQKVGESMSFLSIFVGLEGTSEELGLKGQNIWAFTDRSYLYTVKFCYQK